MICMICAIYQVYDLAHVAGRDPYNLQDLRHMFSWVGCVQPLATAGEEVEWMI